MKHSSHGKLFPLSNTKDDFGVHKLDGLHCFGGMISVFLSFKTRELQSRD